MPLILPMIRRITTDETITYSTDTDEVSTRLLMAEPFNVTYTPTNNNKLSNRVVQ